MSRIQTPTNQKLLTNVAVVRIKKAGKRFEIACYKNKVLSWRRGIETDLDEVLQSHTVFTNVSKGQVAKKEDWMSAFQGLTDPTEVCKLILSNGDLQVSEKERAAQREALFKDVATTVAELCVNPETKRPYPVSLIEKAMKECHIAVKANKGAKQQARDTVKRLQDQIPIERAQMRIKLTFPKSASNDVRRALKTIDLKVESEEKDGEEIVTVCLVDPGQYRVLEELFRKETQGKGCFELLNLKEIVEEEEQF